MAFSLWVRFQVNEPTRFDFAEWMKNDARIAGFNTDAGSIAAYLAAHPNDDKETETLKFTGLSEATAV